MAVKIAVDGARNNGRMRKKPLHGIKREWARSNCPG